MSKASKSIKKPVKAAKKNVPKTVGKKATQDNTTRVVVEVVIKNESGFNVFQTGNEFDTTALSAALTNCPDDKFNYSFEKDKATILSLIVEGFKRDNPATSDSFTTCVFDISDEPKIRVTVLAKQDLPGGRVALTLKFRGKDVFVSKELDKKANGFLGFSELVKLPL